MSAIRFLFPPTLVKRNNINNRNSTIHTKYVKNWNIKVSGPKLRCLFLIRGMSYSWWNSHVLMDFSQSQDGKGHLNTWTQAIPIFNFKKRRQVLPNSVSKSLPNSKFCLLNSHIQFCITVPSLFSEHYIFHNISCYLHIKFYSVEITSFSIRILSMLGSVLSSFALDFLYDSDPSKLDPWYIVVATLYYLSRVGCLY